MIIKGTNTEPVAGISPYDAPKFDSENKIINKCNLCYSGLTEDPLNINTLISKTFNSEKNEKKRG